MNVQPSNRFQTTFRWSPFDAVLQASWSISTWSQQRPMPSWKALMLTFSLHNYMALWTLTYSSMSKMAHSQMCQLDGSFSMTKIMMSGGVQDRIHNKLANGFQDNGFQDNGFQDKRTAEMCHMLPFQSYRQQRQCQRNRFRLLANFQAIPPQQCRFTTRMILVSNLKRRSSPQQFLSKKSQSSKTVKPAWHGRALKHIRRHSNNMMGATTLLGRHPAKTQSIAFSRALPRMPQ